MVYGYVPFLILSMGKTSSFKRISENFYYPHEFQRIAIKDESKIYSAAGDGRIPFVSVDDVARVGFHALTDEKPNNTDYILLGPELLSYDQVQCPQPSTHVRKRRKALELTTSLGRGDSYLHPRQKDHSR